MTTQQDQAGPDTTRTGTSSIAIAGVRQTLDAIYQAWQDNDGQAFAESYVEDATVVLPGTFHQGRAAIAEYMSRGFAGPLKGSRGVDEPRSIRIIGGDTAVVVSTAGILMAGEQQVPTDRERIATWVLVKRDDRWLVAAYANSPAHQV
jgi:uncharacterized protein (TIGR02246 family)